jgi:hypothetical protein
MSCFFPENHSIVTRGGDEESVLQKYGNMQFFEHSSALKVTHHDTHETPFLPLEMNLTMHFDRNYLLLRQ